MDPYQLGDAHDAEAVAFGWAKGHAAGQFGRGAGAAQDDVDPIKLPEGERPNSRNHTCD